MKAKIIAYKIVSSANHNIEPEVNELVLHGWQPLGPVVFGPSIEDVCVVAQTMVMYDEQPAQGEIIGEQPTAYVLTSDYGQYEGPGDVICAFTDKAHATWLYEFMRNNETSKNWNLSAVPLNRDMYILPEPPQ